MLTMQDFLVLLVVVLQLMILNFLMEMDRAVRHRATADNNEQRAVRPEFITNVETRRRRENEIIAFRQTEIVPQKVMNARTEKTGYTV